MPLPEQKRPEDVGRAVPRRAWVPPQLTKHDSLSALTQQQYQRYPVYPDSLDPTQPYADIPCSQGFCP